MKELIDLLRNQASTVSGYGVPVGSDEAILAGQFMAAADALERAETLAEALAGIRWISADRDNMEFAARITYVQMNAITAALKAYREASHG